ncbi:lytic transglycosylase domain-containing protein [Asticcacaulis excentricus]|nr:lytic transglycosylase domain-containing protein [Asticcacaulis excentricus]
MRAVLTAAGTMGAVLCAALPAAAQVFEVADNGDYHTLCASVPPATVHATSLPYQDVIKAAAERYNLSTDFLIAVIRQESGFNPKAVSPRGAIGLMQLMPATAAELGVDPFDPRGNVFGGAAYLRRQLDRFDGRIDLALAAYNAGAGAVNRHGGVPPYAETQAYVARSLDRLSVKTDPQPTETCS